MPSRHAPTLMATPLTATPKSEADRAAKAMLRAAMAGADVLAGFTADETLWRTHKADGSYVTAADLASDAAIKEALREQLPGIPVVSEESPDAAGAKREFVLVDPLDGTSEFMQGGPEFAVAVAYIIEGRPLAGAIVAPRIGKAWFSGTNAWEADFTPGHGIGEARSIAARQGRQRDLVALVSPRHADEWSTRAVADLSPAVRRPVSSALKFGLIANGEAQLHIRCGPTMEWDVAAGDAILQAAGGFVSNLQGAPLIYGQPRNGFRNPPFVAAAGSSVLARALAAVQRAS